MNSPQLKTAKRKLIVHELCISQGNNNNLRRSYSGRKWDINNSEVRGSRRKLSDNFQNKLFSLLLNNRHLNRIFWLILINIIIEGNFTGYVFLLDSVSAPVWKWQISVSSVENVSLSQEFVEILVSFLYKIFDQVNLSFTV